MTDMWNKLVILLNRTLVLYQTLLESGRKKRAILTEADARQLELLTNREDVLLIEAGKLEIERVNLVQKIAARLALNETSLSCLCQYADSETAPKLKNLSGQLAQVTQELVKTNELNTKLIRQSLELINFNINILSQSSVGPTYAPQGRSAASAASRILLDAKV